jgi:hypothetical protein
MGISRILRWFFAAAAALIIPGCGRSSLKEPEIFGGPADAAMDDSRAEPPYPDMPLADIQPEGGCTGDGQCDDGVFCNGAERCVSGRCAAGQPVSCDDGQPCTRDSCVEFLRSCISIPYDGACPPGFICDPREGCVQCAATETSCFNGRDDDCDGLQDCDDPDCGAAAFCTTGNDTCDSAASVDTWGLYRGTTAGLGGDYVGGCGGEGPDAVFTGFNGEERCIEIFTSGATWNTVLYLRGGDCARGAEFACDSGSFGADSTMRFDQLPRGRYYIFIDGLAETDAGEYTVTVRQCGSENCANGRDDDGDTLADCADPECDYHPACP